jgi:hypothetical protein
MSPDKLHRVRKLDDDETPSIQRMRRSVDVPRSEAATPILSPIQSRRASLLLPRDGDDKLDLIRGNKDDKDKDKDKENEKEKLHGKQEKQKVSPSTE